MRKDHIKFNQMVNYQSSPLDHTFAALSDPTRRAILMRLASGPVSVGDLAKPFRMSLPAVSKHLRVLTQAGLLIQEKKGRIRHCNLVARPMQDAAEWIQFYRKFWDARLDALDHYLQQPSSSEGS